MSHSDRITGLDQTAGCRMSGYTPEEPIGEDWSALTGTDIPFSRRSVARTVHWPDHPSGTAMAASSLTRFGPDLERIHSVGAAGGVGTVRRFEEIGDVIGAVRLTG